MFMFSGRVGGGAMFVFLILCSWFYYWCGLVWWLVVNVWLLIAFYLFYSMMKEIGFLNFYFGFDVDLKGLVLKLTLDKSEELLPPSLINFLRVK